VNTEARHAIAVLLASSVLFCTGRREDQGAPAGSPAGDDPRAAATLGGKPVTLKSFERYLAENAGDDQGEMEQEDTIKSRLLDQMIEEQLLLGAAEGLRITVSEAEIDAYMQQIGVTEGEAEIAGGEGKEAFRERIRQSLILQKVKDQAVLSKVQVTPGEVEDYYRKHPELFREARSLVLRQILVDDKSLADRLSDMLATDPTRFEALAREHSVAPDRGQARMYTEEVLPVELREPLFALQEGQVSGVLENAQRYLLFQLVRKIDGKDLDLGEVKRRIQLELFQKKGEQALERFIADLKKETEIRVNRSILPFDYVGEYRN
jgi:parvulin-like peptidyl-prolyl isomerase